jgi:lipopolysaccharide biosynthesis protein
VKQIELAQRYGVGGFCHYFYWFTGGRRVLERPLEHLLGDDAPDFPFCLCWANENWTRTWDGEETDILLAQTYSEGDAHDLITAMTPFLKRENYIRVDGKPLVLIYRASLLPDPKAWTRIIREHCRAEGIGEILLAYVEVLESARDLPDPVSLGFDASVEFPPSESASPMPTPGTLFNSRFHGTVNDYRGLARRRIEAEPPGHMRFRGVTPSWDNTARRQDASYIFHNASPGAFQAWLEIAMAETRRQNAADARLVFVNAWNEWAEGAHLEPDVRFGHGWLEAVKNAADADLLGG